MIPSSKRIYLCSPDRSKLYVLNGVQTDTVDFHALAKGYSELSFDYDRFLSIDGRFVESNGYDDLKPYMYLYLEDIGYFQMQAPSINYDGDKEIKSINAYSAEKEFEDKDWQGIKINTGEDDSYERLVDGNISDLKETITYITMVNYQKPKLSFLHLVLEKVSQWSIGYVDPAVRNAKIPSLDIDNENLYAVMTSEVAPRMSCIFIFDYLNFTINVYHKNNLDFDTGIFIGFRNLAQSIDCTVDESSVFTRFTVVGDNNLTFESYNYGDPQAFDLSYFLGEPYMDQELADKIQDWIDFRDEYREQYISLTEEYDKINVALNTLKYRVPADEDYWANWDGLNLEGKDGLLEQKNFYEIYLETFQKAVDDRPISEKYNEQEEYQPKLINGTNNVDHEWYLGKLYNQMDTYSGYYTYLDIIVYILPYIEIAISNVGKTPEQKIKPADDASENWALYGYEELEGVRKSYEEDLITRLAKYSKDWDEMTEDERIEKSLNYTSEEGYEASPGRTEYLKYKTALGNPNGQTYGTIYYYLRTLSNEIRLYEEQLSGILDEISDYNNLARYDITAEEVEAITNIPQSIINARLPLFTSDEIDLITTLFHDTDYQNTNILTTSIYDTSMIMATKKELYDDAMDKLSEVSQPQYTFKTSLDNFMRLDDYYDWAEEFNPAHINTDVVQVYDIAPKNGLLKFVRLGIRDDYAVKLRVIGYRWNPCEITPDLQLEFSNMIVSKSGRTDFTELLDTDNNRAAKNSISVGLGNSDSDKAYIASLLQVLTSNSIFTKAAQSAASGVVCGTDSVQVSNIISDYMGTHHIEADQINVSNIIGTTAQFESLFTNYLGAETVVTKLVSADEGIIDNLVTKIITVGEDGITQITEDAISTATISADQIDVTSAFVDDILQIGTDSITTIAEGTITTENIVSTLVQAQNAEIENLVTKIITVGEDGITQITEDAISTATISADQIDVTSAFVSEVLQVGTDSITTIAEGTITTEKIVTTLVQAEEGAIDSLVSKIITVGEDGITQLTEDTIRTATIDATQINVNSAFVEDILRIGTNTITTIADGTITTDNIIAKLVEAESGDFDDLTANTAFIEYLNSGIIEAGTVSADTIIAGLVDVDNADDFSLLADSAFIDYLENNIIVSHAAYVDNLQAQLAEIDVADIDELYADSAFISSLQSLSSTSAQSVINDAYIYNAVAGKIAVADLAAGDITLSNSMQIVSENGKLVMNGSALQIMGIDSNGYPYVGVQLGYATNGQPSLVLRNEDGATIVDPTGITSDAIADGLIINNMIHDGTISESKLGFNVMKQGDTISIEQIYTGNGQFGVEYTEFKNGTNSALQDLRSDLDDFGVYDLYIETPSGTNIRGGNIQLNVKLLKNNVDVTNDFDASCFKWTRTSRDHDADTYWNSNHSQGAKVITITGNDVRINADFQCKFEYENITVVAG